MSLLRDSRHRFFFPSPPARSHTNTYTKQTKDSSCLSHWHGKGSERSDFLGHAVPRLHGWALCHSTLHRVSMKWQDSPCPPPPPTCSCFCLYFNCLLVQQAWDAENELGWKGKQRPAQWQWIEHEAKEMGDSPTDLISCPLWSGTF